MTEGLVPFEAAKNELMQELANYELEIQTTLKFEPQQYFFDAPSPLPVEHLRPAIKRIRAHWKQTFELEPGEKRETILLLMTSWVASIGEKFVLESYTRPWACLVSPQVIAAACLYLAEMYSHKLRVCSQVLSLIGESAQQKIEGSKVYKEILQMPSLLPTDWPQLLFPSSDRAENQMSIEEVTRLAEEMLEDCFQGYIVYD